MCITLKCSCTIRLINRNVHLVSAVVSRWITVRHVCAILLAGVRPSVCLFLVQQPPVGQVLLIHEVSRSHNDAPQSVGLLWTSD